MWNESKKGNTMDEEKVISTGEQQSGEKHRSSEHRHHSSRHRRHRSRGENLEGKRESWRRPHQKKRLRKRIASAAFAFLSVLAVILMLYVAYIYLN